jgi:hypothetical protein
MNPDFVDLLRAFLAADVRFLIVGAYALALFRIGGVLIGRIKDNPHLHVWPPSRWCH